MVDLVLGHICGFTGDNNIDWHIYAKWPKGIWGRGGIEFVVGLLFPLAFILLL